MDYRDTSFPVIHSYLKMQRYFIYLSFNGAQYHGWQIQPNGITVQKKKNKSPKTRKKVKKNYKICIHNLIL